MPICSDPIGRHFATAQVLAIAGAAAPAAPQTVSGTVREDGSGTAVRGAVVVLQQLGEKARAGASIDSAGVFVMPLGSGSARYIISAEHPSYLPFADTIRLDGQETVTLEIRLGREASRTQATGFRERVERREGFGKFLTRDELDRMPAIRATEFLRRVPGVRLQR